MGVSALLACVYFLGAASNVTQYYPLVANLPRVELGGNIQNFVDELIKYLAGFDPLYVDKYSDCLFSYAFGVEGLHLEGFSDIDFKVSIDVSVETKLKTSVGLKRVFGSVKSWENTFPHIFGNGTARFDINNTFASLEVDYSAFTGLKPSKIITSIEKADVFVSGVLYDDDYSAKVTENINNFLNIKFNSSEFQTFLQDVVDALLKDLLEEGEVSKRR